MDATQCPEEWRPVPGFEGLYEVSDLGRVRSVEGRKIGQRRFKSRIRVLQMSRNGYLKVSLHKDGIQTISGVHALVLAAFVGPRPEGMERLHNNGIRDDNRASNLRYGTRSENMYDAIRHGTHYHGCKTHCKYGHEFTPENTYMRVGKRRGRVCRKCAQDYGREYWRARNRKAEVF